MKRKKTNITTNWIFIMCALLIMFNFLLGAYLMSHSKALVKKLINDRMLDIVNTSADMLNGDYLENLDEDSPGTPEYNEIYRTLKLFQDNINLEFIYTIRDMKDGTFIFTVDPHGTAPAEYGELVKVTPALQTAATGIPSVDEEPHQDAWGYFYSAYSPVYNSNGDISGLVCVDFNAKWYNAQLSRYSLTTLLFSFLSLLVGVIVTFLVNTKVRNRLAVLNNEIIELSKDVEDLLIDVDDAPNAAFPQSDHSFAAEAQNQSQDELTFLSSILKMIHLKLREKIENSNLQEKRMITALASDYRSVYYVDFDTDEGICYRTDPKSNDGIEEGTHFPYTKQFTDYANSFVAEADRKGFLEFIDPENVRRRLDKEIIIAYRYLTIKNGIEHYEMLRMAGVRHKEDRVDHIVHAVGVGFSDVDLETRESMARANALNKALSLAEEANIAKTSFLSSMSHEIRTPMNAIIGLNSLALKDPDLSSHTRSYLQKIDNSANHLLKLINSILDMNRIESGRMILQNEEFSFKEVLEEINNTTNDLCHSKGLTYTCLINGPVEDHYIGDDMKLKQVLLNILDNAVKFTPAPGNVTFTIDPLTRFEENAALRFTITDTGIGISKDFIPKIFDTFSQENENQANKYGSTGLGMAITKNIVEMMNGKIDVESEKGSGTTVTVTLTFKTTDNVSVSSENTSDMEETSGLSGKHILLVEDTDINAEIMMEVLNMKDMTADLAENGQIAVDIFSKNNPGTYDAILMDIRMPVMNGLEATEAIRALSRPDAKTIPIIAMTANAFDEDVQRSLQAGMNAHLSKPVEPDILFDTLERLIYRAR